MREKGKTVQTTLESFFSKVTVIRSAKNDYKNDLNNNLTVNTSSESAVKRKEPLNPKINIFANKKQKTDEKAEDYQKEPPSP